MERLGVRSSLIYTDHGLTGTNRARPGLREALAACRAGDTLVVAKLDRLARSLRDAKDIIDELTTKDVKLSIGGAVHDPKDPPSCQRGIGGAIQRCAVDHLPNHSTSVRIGPLIGSLNRRLVAGQAGPATGSLREIPFVHLKISCTSVEWNVRLKHVNHGPRQRL